MSGSNKEDSGQGCVLHKEEEIELKSRYNRKDKVERSERNKGEIKLLFNGKVFKHNRNDKVELSE